MNFSSIASALAAADTFINSPEVSALAALGGAKAEGVVAMIQGVAKISSAVLADATAAGDAIAGGDLASIQAADASIQAQNNSLAEQVAAS